MEGYDCDVRLVSGPDPYWVINDSVTVELNLKQGTAFISAGDERVRVKAELDEELDVFLTDADDFVIVFAPPDHFKAAVMRSMTNAQYRPASRYADTIERTLFE